MRRRPGKHALPFPLMPGPAKARRPIHHTNSETALRQFRLARGGVAVVTEHRLLPATAPLNDVMRKPRHDDTRQPGHVNTPT